MMLKRTYDDINIFGRHCETFIDDFKKCVCLFIDGSTENPSTKAIDYYDQLVSFFDSFIQQSEDGEYIEDYLAATYRIHLAGEPRYYIDYAYIHYIRAKELYSDRSIDNSWADLLHAFHQLGIARGIYEQRYLYGDKIYSHEIIGYSKQSKAGSARAKLYKPIKNKIIKLLHENKPEGGWPFKQSAINDIIDYVREFVIEEDTPLTSDNLENTIKNWSRKDKKVKEAFSQVVKSRKVSYL